MIPIKILLIAVTYVLIIQEPIVIVEPLMTHDFMQDERELEELTFSPLIDWNLK